MADQRGAAPVPGSIHGQDVNRADDSYQRLVQARHAYYGTCLVPSLAPLVASTRLDAVALFAHRHLAWVATTTVAAYYLPLSLVLGSAWAVVVALSLSTMTLLAIYSTYNRLRRRAPVLPGAVVAALTDFEAAEPTLHDAGVEAGTLAVVTWFEPRVERLRALLVDPEVSNDVRVIAEDELRDLGARSWALAELARQQTEVITAAVTVEPEQDTVESYENQFADLDAAAAAIAAQTIEVADAFGVPRPVALNASAEQRSKTTHVTRPSATLRDPEQVQEFGFRCRAPGGRTRLGRVQAPTMLAAIKALESQGMLNVSVYKA